MSNMALEPTYENVIHHYLEDTIGRNDDLFYFCTYTFRIKFW